MTDYGIDIHAARAVLDAKERRRRGPELLRQARHDAANIRRWLIVEMEKLDVETRERIIRRGQLVYDRSSSVAADGEWSR